LSRYLLDANVFIQGKNLHYGFDFCPAFWDWLVEQNQAGVVASIEKVSDELVGAGDELADWATARGRPFFLAPDDAVLPALGDGTELRTSCNRHLPPGCRLLAYRPRKGSRIYRGDPRRYAR